MGQSIIEINFNNKHILRIIRNKVIDGIIKLYMINFMIHLYKALYTVDKTMIMILIVNKLIIN